MPCRTLGENDLPSSGRMEGSSFTARPSCPWPSRSTRRRTMITTDMKSCGDPHVCRLCLRVPPLRSVTKRVGHGMVRSRCIAPIGHETHGSQTQTQVPDPGPESQTEAFAIEEGKIQTRVDARGSGNGSSRSRRERDCEYLLDVIAKLEAGWPARRLTDLLPHSRG
jgi:hypothetical protein